MESENGITPDRSLKRTPKKEKAMTMLDLPLKKKQKQTHHNRSETLLTPPEGQSSGYATFPFFSNLNYNSGPSQGLKIRGAHSTVVGIICPLVEIGLTVLPNIGGAEVPKVPPLRRP